MADTDVAKEVEAADLKQMHSMDVDNVYTLMDVQLRERPDARELYKRWEKQNWAVYDLDWSKDKQDWDNLPDAMKEQFIFGMYAFFVGEAAVTDTLSPMVHAAPTDEDRQFLSTQLVDEARHTIFFDEFFRNVMGIDGLEGTRALPEVQEMLLNSQERGYGKLFYKDLVEVTDAVRLDPGNYEKWVASIVIYHMLIEGMLALYGQRQLLQATRLFDVLPAFRAGFTAVTRDESRHVNYGVYALRQAVEKGLAKHIVDTVELYYDGACDLLTRPVRKIEMPDEAIMAMVPEELQQDSFWEQWDFPMVQLRKRLRGAGVADAPIDEIDKMWFSRIDVNIDEYEERFGEPHPAALETEARQKILSDKGVLV